MVRPAKAMRPLSVLCEQCSLHVWASVSSSQSVGSRPRDSKCARIAQHLGEAQRELPRPAQRHQLVVPQTPDRDIDPAEGVALRVAQSVEVQRADDRLFDGVVRQQPLDQPGE